MMVLEGHGLDVAPKSKVANMLFLAAKITSQLHCTTPLKNMKRRVCLVSAGGIKPKFCLTTTFLFFSKMAKLGNNQALLA